MWTDLEEDIVQTFSEVAIEFHEWVGMPSGFSRFGTKKRKAKPHYKRTEEQRRHRAKTSTKRLPRKAIAVAGVSYAFADACRKFAVNPATARGRILLGWSTERVFGVET